jgi:hypothetical protein
MYQDNIEKNTNNTILYYNVLTQQLHDPITESTQEDKTNTKNRKQN